MFTFFRVRKQKLGGDLLGHPAGEWQKQETEEVSVRQRPHIHCVLQGAKCAWAPWVYMPLLGKVVDAVQE